MSYDLMIRKDLLNNIWNHKSYAKVNVFVFIKMIKFLRGDKKIQTVGDFNIQNRSCGPKNDEEYRISNQHNWWGRSYG